MEELKTCLAKKEKQVEEMSVKNMSLTQDLTMSARKLAGSEETRRFLMMTGISEIVAKCRASHEFGKLVGRLSANIQAMGKTDLVRELHPLYFSKEKMETIPGFYEKAED